MGIGVRIKRAMEAAGKLPVDIATHLGITESAVSQWFAKDSGPKRERLQQLATFLNTTVPWLLSDDDTLPAINLAANDTGREPIAYPQVAVTHLPNSPGRPDIPVWASAQAGEDGAIVLTPDPIDYIHRSDRMRGVKNPFAFYVVGSSMSPVIEHGIQVVINPSLPPMPGRDHVFIQDLLDGTMKAMVKRLLRSTEKAWRVRQYNELKDFDLSRSVWTKAYRISEKRED